MTNIIRFVCLASFILGISARAGVVSYQDTISGTTYTEDAALETGSFAQNRNFGSTTKLPVSASGNHPIFRITTSGWATMQGTILDSIGLGFVLDSVAIGSSGKVDSMQWVYRDWAEGNSDSVATTTFNTICSWLRYSAKATVPQAESTWTTSGAFGVGTDISTSFTQSIVDNSKSAGDTIHFMLTDTSEINAQKRRDAGHRGFVALKFNFSGVHRYSSSEGAKPWYAVIYSHSEVADAAFVAGYRNGILGAIYRNGIPGKCYYHEWVTP